MADRSEGVGGVKAELTEDKSSDEDGVGRPDEEGVAIERASERAVESGKWDVCGADPWCGLSAAAAVVGEVGAGDPFEGDPEMVVMWEEWNELLVGGGFERSSQ